MISARTRIGFFLPHLRSGGAERVALNWIVALDRTRYEPLLFLTRIEGAFLDLLPPDVRPIPIGGTRAIGLARPIAACLARHDIAVAYSATNAMNLALLAARAGETARIVSEHTSPDGYLAEAKWAALRRAAMRWLYPRADRIAVPTDAIGSALTGLVGHPLRVTTLANPVIDAPTALAAVRNARAGPCHIVAAGRLVPAKGFDTLIDGCALLRARGIDYRLAIHGEGPLRADLAARIAAAGLGDRVTLAGQSDWLGAAIAAADLFVLSSRREGFGNVVVEAMAAGTPVLATRSDGPQALIRDGENGFLVAVDDPIALADRIAALIADPAHRESVRADAWVTAHAYDVQASTRAFEALVDTLVPTRSMAA